MSGDPVNPDHYKASVSGIECIEITRWLSFNLGNAVKYLWRCGLKDDPTLEVQKAIWYLSDEIDRLARPVASWVLPVQMLRWADDFGHHLQTMTDSPVREVLYDIREAVADQSVSMLKSARQQLRVWEPKVSKVSEEVSS